MSFTRRQFLTTTSAVLGSTCFRSARSDTATNTTLPIPTLVDGSAGDPVDLQIRRGEWSFKPGVKTPTLGFSQDYLGPTIRTRKGSELNLHYHNTLDEYVAVHGHGLHVPGSVDGGPQPQMPAGEKWQPSLVIVQPAATCWYHSHTHCSTGHQVYHGLAGMIIIIDDDTDAMDLPNRYGVDDLPVIIQDRTFDVEGKLVYSLNNAGEDGWYGDTVTINGAVAPTAKVPAGKVRLRLDRLPPANFSLVPD
jgi:FtsP/CotA-like multicopper oxidase with cupredoxin domain